MRRFKFRIIPVYGKEFEIVKLGDSAIEAYIQVLNHYASYALNIIPLGGK